MISNYIPVNLNRNNAMVYSSNAIYPVDLLLKVHDVLSSGNTNEVIVNDGVITMLTNPDIKWHLTDFYLAHNAYKAAVENKFSFYIVKNEHDVPALFISKQFNGNRIMCNAYTMESVLVTSKRYVSKISTMIDHVYPNKYCMNLFNVIANIMKGSSKYISAILVNKDNPECEHLRISPVTAPYLDGIVLGYTPGLIEEFRNIMNGATETESLIYSAGFISFKPDSMEEDVVIPPFTYSYLTDVVSAYDKVIKKNVSYVPIYVETYNGVEVNSYLSTDGTILVNAETFECVKLRNAQVIRLFALFASRDACTASDLSMGWSIVKAEK